MPRSKPADPSTASPASSSPDPDPPYDRDALFAADGPINPDFVVECVRTLLRALPLETREPPAWANRRMASAMMALSALHPRDEIEVMLGVQALSAYHAAAACWRLGMNAQRPFGDSTRHMTAAANAARTFDSLLKALERRQAKPLSIPVGRPPPRTWDPRAFEPVMTGLEIRGRQGGDAADWPIASDAELASLWTPHYRTIATQVREIARIEHENAGLDLENTEGILPGGGMIVPEDPTPQQDAYLARRYAISLRRQHDEDLRNGIKRLPVLRPVRPGDRIA